MGTPFEEIFLDFLMEIRSYSFVTMTDEQIEQELTHWLKRATKKFSRKCIQPIADTDFNAGAFSVELTPLEREILLNYMLLGFMSPYVYDIEALSQKLNSREYRTYSEANFLEAKAKIRDRIDRDLNRNLSHYSEQVIIEGREGGFFSE